MALKIFLLADDDQDDADFFHEALVGKPILSHYARNGLEALHKLKTLEEKPHLIFLDINMPVMNGWQCLKALKENEECKHIPVIIYSTSSHQRDIDIARNMGALCFFTKPDNFSELRNSLHLISVNVDTDVEKTIWQLQHLKGVTGLQCAKD